MATIADILTKIRARLASLNTKTGRTDGDLNTAINALPSKKTEGDVTVSGKTVTTPSGIYFSDVSKSVSDGGCTVSGGGLSVTNNYSGTPTVDITLDGQTTSGAAITTTRPQSGYYLTLGASSSALSGTTQVTRADITDTYTAGYIPAKTTTTVISSATANPTVTVNKNTKTEYVTIPTGACTVSGGDLTAGEGSAAATGSGITLGTATTTKPDSGNYITVTGSGQVSRADIKDAHTAGYIPEKSATTVIVGDTASSNTATVYYPISSNIVDTSSGDAASSDIIGGKKAWVDGEEVTGNIAEHDSAVPFSGSYWHSEDEDNHIFWAYLDEKIAIKDEIDLAIPKADFGDAYAECVPNIYTFTSQDGVNIQGKAPYYDGRPIKVDPTSSTVNHIGTVTYYADIFSEYMDEWVESEGTMGREFFVPNYVTIEMDANKFGDALQPFVRKKFSFTSGAGINIQGSMEDYSGVTSITPSDSSQTFLTSGKYVGSNLTVNAIPSSYIVPSGTKTISSSGTHDVKSYAKASVAAGAVSTPATSITANPTISDAFETGKGYKMSVSATQSVTPSVTTAGYVSSGTAGDITVSGSAYVPKTNTTLSSWQTRSDGEIEFELWQTTGYTTAQRVFITIAPEDLDSYFKPENIKAGVTICGVTGTYEGAPAPAATCTFNVGTDHAVEAVTVTYVYQGQSKTITIPVYSSDYTFSVDCNTDMIWECDEGLFFTASPWGNNYYANSPATLKSPSTEGVYNVNLDNT